jgi:hypothetical protein
MGERLAKEVDAIFKAKIEQRPPWQKMTQEGGASAADAPELLLATIGALREVVLYIAREVDDPPRRDDT